MPRGPRSNPTTIALWVNAVLLCGILVALLGRSIPGGNEAFAQQAMPPIAGGGGLFFMPGQIDSNLYGVYAMDVDRQTLMVYTFVRGEKTLRLTAARDISFDRDLRRYNTDPHPDDIAELLSREADDARVRESGENAARSTAEDPNANNDGTPDSPGESPNE
ncbi:MAG: hypothetical protein AAGD32_07520 [Planctomycetota bacterium]